MRRHDLWPKRPFAAVGCFWNWKNVNEAKAGPCNELPTILTTKTNFMVNLYNQDREALHELMRRATLFAITTMRDHGEIEPTLFMQGDSGNGRFTVPYLADEQAKDEFAK